MIRLNYGLKSERYGLVLAGLLVLAMPNVAAADWRDYISLGSMPKSNLSISQVADSFRENRGVIFGAAAVVGVLGVLLWKAAFGGGQKSETWWKVKVILADMPREAFRTLAINYETAFGVKLSFTDYEDQRAYFATKLLERNKNDVCKFLLTTQERLSKAVEVMSADNKVHFEKVIAACEKLSSILQCSGASSEVSMVERNIQRAVSGLFTKIDKKIFMDYLREKKWDSTKSGLDEQAFLVRLIKRQYEMNQLDLLDDLRNFRNSAIYPNMIQSKKDAFEYFLTQVRSIFTHQPSI